VAARNDEEERLREVALQNVQSILAARQRAEQKLAESLALMRATLEASTDGILAVDSSGHVTHYNERYLDMWRLPRGAGTGGTHVAIARGSASKLKAPEAFVARIEEIYATAPPETEDVLDLADGRVVERFSRVQIIEGKAVGRVWTFRDITQRRQAEEALARLYDSERAARAEAERMGALKDEFLATLSHELRTPLGAILGWAQVLRRRVVSQHELHEALDIIERNARVQTQLIEDLLDMSRITSGKVRLDAQPVAPASFIEAAIETVRPAAEAKGIRLEKILDPLAGPVSGDPHRLQQVVWNLLSNAIKFTPKEGKVQVVLERVNSHVEISVADSGIGIKPEFIGHVFERFRQADAGLGRSIVRSLVELHGGTVAVHSDGEGRGSTFTVHLPVSAVHRPSGERLHPAAAPVSSAFLPTDLTGLNILVVDDQADALHLLSRVLGECGARVFTAQSASDALAIVAKDRLDMLVSDIGMPGMDGYELLKRVRALGADRGNRIAAIALTAFARTEDRTRALRAGFLAHVSKPVDPSELVATIATVAGRIAQ
jgi:signal transduction histidine kinase